MSHRVKAGVLAGPKIGGRHGSLSEGGEFIVRVTKGLDCVSKVIPGPITNVGSGPRRLKFDTVHGGLKVKVRIGLAAQNIIIHTDNPAEAQKKILTAWNDRY